MSGCGGHREINHVSREWHSVLSVTRSAPVMVGHKTHLLGGLLLDVSFLLGRLQHAKHNHISIQVRTFF